MKLTMLDWSVSLWRCSRTVCRPPLKEVSLRVLPLSRLFSIYNICCPCWCSQYACHNLSILGSFTDTNMGWADVQKWLGMLDWHLKINWQPSPHRLISDLNTQWQRRGTQTHKGIQPFTHLWAHYVNAVHHTVSALVPNPVWAWPLTLLPRWSPADSEDQRGPICFVSARYAFTATTRDILSPRIYVSQLKPAPHRETVSVSCLRLNIWVYLSLSVFRGHAPGTLWISDRYELSGGNALSVSR